MIVNNIVNNQARCCNKVRKNFLLLAALFIAVLPARSQSTTPSRSTANKVQLPEGPGKQIVEAACISCHDISQFARVNFAREDWDVAVNTMAASGAPLKKEEIPLVIDYMAKNFKGDNTPGVLVPGPVQATITEWDVPTPHSMPHDSFYTKRGGFTWYSGEFANVLGRFEAKTQKFEEIHLRPGSSPYALVEHAGSGVQGTIYFTSHTGGFIGEFDPNTRNVREFRIAGPKLLLHDIAFDPNGVVWFTVMAARPPQYPQGSKIGSVNIFSSEIKLADTPTRDVSPYGLAVNSKGIPFFSEANRPVLGSVDPVTMKVTEYPLPNRKIGVKGITITRDDMVWYTDYLRGYLGRFDPRTGRFNEWPSPSGRESRPYAITNVGNIIWYSETGTKPNMLVRFDPKTEKFQSWPVKAGGGIKHIYAESEGSLWFTRPLTNGIAQVIIKEE